MPPFTGTSPLPPSSPATVPARKSSEPNIVTLNVGGHLFQTTRQTLSLAGSNSLLSALADSTTSDSTPFLDRDPDLFSPLLSLLRTGRLPSSVLATFDLQDLADEARFYGLHHLLVAALSSPSHFDGFDLHRSLILPFDSPSAVSVTPVGSLHVAHGSKITSFDWSLRRRSTVLTCFPVVDSLLALSPSLAAAGATDFPGLNVIDLENGTVVKSLHWASVPSPAGPKSTVQAIGSSPGLLFGSFESCRRNASAIVAFDLGEGTLLPVAEIGRQDVYGADIESAIPATKLRWAASSGLLMASGSHAGPSGLVGNVRLWDVRSCTAAWELRETADCFADVTVSDGLNAMFKVGFNSGDVFMADLRMLSGKDDGRGTTWVRLRGEKRGGAAAGGKGKKGSGCKIESHGEQVFCSRGGDVDMWSEVVMGEGGGWGMEDGVERGARVMRRDVMGRARDGGGGSSRIAQLVFGGNRMVVTRREQQCVEVWESCSAVRR